MPQEKTGLKIERPKAEQVSIFYSILTVVSLILILLTLWLLILEWTGQPLPTFLRTVSVN